MVSFKSKAGNGTNRDRSLRGRKFIHFFGRLQAVITPPPITKNALFFPIIIIATILHIFQQAFHHYLLIMQKLRLL